MYDGFGDLFGRVSQVPELAQLLTFGSGNYGTWASLTFVSMMAILLLPALHALQDRVGQITQPGLNYVCRRLSVPPAEAYGVATFYALLSTAIELRGAPFIFWIHDLSLPDPYYVMPVLVGASQVITQLMTPQPGADPVQQRMMLVMPVVLIFVFISTPAGALIYWLVGNIWRMGQMQVTNYIHPPQVKAYRPAAERRIKQAGRGKSSGAAQDK